MPRRSNDGESMSAGLNDRRLVQIRRRGRHTTPSQVEKVAEKAGKAAPAMAIAGALVAAPQAQHFLDKPATVAAAQAPTSSTAQEGGADATLDSIISRGVASAFAAVQRAADEASAAMKTATAKTTAPTTTYYKVQAGDSLSKISERFYHSPQDWSYIYHVNDTKISNPDVITAGTVLRIPAHLPAGYVPSDYVPRHAAVTPSSSSTASPSPATPAASQPASSTSAASTTQPSSSGGSSTPSGTLSCSGLEQLWDQAGGNSADAFMAAEIAMAESGGNQYALSPTDDYGYWQINASNGALATFDPLGNAHAAITLSHDGTDWSAWTTYTSGAYAGRC